MNKAKISGFPVNGCLPRYIGRLGKHVDTLLFHDVFSRFYILGYLALQASKRYHQWQSNRLVILLDRLVLSLHFCYKSAYPRTTRDSSPSLLTLKQVEAIPKEIRTVRQLNKKMQVNNVQYA